MTLTLNTFSIVARSADAKSYGVAVATARPAVGTLVPFVNKHGAIATQAAKSLAGSQPAVSGPGTTTAYGLGIGSLKA